MHSTERGFFKRRCWRPRSAWPYAFESRGSYIHLRNFLYETVPASACFGLIRTLHSCGTMTEGTTRSNGIAADMSQSFPAFMLSRPDGIASRATARPATGQTVAAAQTASGTSILIRICRKVRVMFCFLANLKVIFVSLRRAAAWVPGYFRSH